MENKRTRKVNPFQFTIRFSETLPKHRVAVAFLNKCGRGKGQVIADALELYIEHYGITDAFEDKKEEVHQRKRKQAEQAPIMRNIPPQGYYESRQPYQQAYPSQNPQMYAAQNIPVQPYYGYPQMAVSENIGNNMGMQQNYQSVMSQQNWNDMSNGQSRRENYSDVPRDSYERLSKTVQYEDGLAESSGLEDLTDDESLLMSSMDAFDSMDEEDF